MNGVIYARYSDHGQGEQSIEGQLRDNYAFAEREGITVVDVYIDRAKTGRYDDRPDFQRMIKDAEKHQFERIIVWKLDRFARNRYDSAIYKARLKKHSVKVLSATEYISDSPEGIILEGMLESMAEYYSANLSQNVKRGIRESLEAKTYLGAPTPIGFRVQDLRLVKHDFSGPAMDNAFHQLADDVPTDEILQRLHSIGIRNSAGKPLTRSSLQKAFRSKKYIGIYEYDGVEYEGICDRITDDETFQRAQVVLDGRMRAPAASKAEAPYLLSGKIFCGPCGARMIGESGRGRHGDWFHYYKCSGRKRLKNCKKANERKGFIEWYVVEQTVSYVLHPARMDYIAARVVEQYDSEFNNEKISALEKLIARLDRNVNNAVDAALEAPAAARSRFYAKVEELEAQKADAEISLARLRIANDIRYTKEQIVAWMTQFCKGDPLDAEFQERIIDVFVNAVYVYDDKVVIYYNIKDGQQVSYMDMLTSSEESGSESPPDDTTGVRISNAMAHHNLSENASFRTNFLCQLTVGQSEKPALCQP